MKNPCGTTRATIIQNIVIKGIPIYFGTGVNPVNSPAQFFVAWGRGVLIGGLIRTFNSESPEEGFLWFVDEDEAESKYVGLQQVVKESKGR